MLTCVVAQTGPSELETFYRLAVALGLGLLVGLEREYAAKSMAGIRTFALITLTGALVTLAAESLGGWLVFGGLIGLALVLMAGYFHQSTVLASKPVPGPGITTEVAALAMFALGCTVMLGYVAESIVVGGIAALLLHWKQPLHTFVQKMGPADFRALVRLVIIALIILPVLPNEDYGPYKSLNPFRMWLLVVLVVAISLVAYVTYRLIGARVGTLLAGALGGLISSTATTVSYARQAKQAPEAATGAAIVVILASTVVFARVLFEIGLVASNLMWHIAPPLIAMGLWMLLLSLGTFVLRRREIETPPQNEPPSVLKAAIIFGVLYGVIKFAVAAVNANFGQGALYPVAIISGLTDMDAITLSVAQMASDGRITADQAWRLILVAGMSNNVFKGLIAALLGTWALGWRVGALFMLSLVGGGLILWLWPAGGAAQVVGN